MPTGSKQGGNRIFLKNLLISPRQRSQEQGGPQTFALNQGERERKLWKENFYCDHTVKGK